MALLSLHWLRGRNANHAEECWPRNTVMTHGYLVVRVARQSKRVCTWRSIEKLPFLVSLKSTQAMNSPGLSESSSECFLGLPSWSAGSKIAKLSLYYSSGDRDRPKRDDDNWEPHLVDHQMLHLKPLKSTSQYRSARQHQLGITRWVTSASSLWVVVALLLMLSWAFWTSKTRISGRQTIRGCLLQFLLTPSLSAIWPFDCQGASKPELSWECSRQRARQQAETNIGGELLKFPTKMFFPWPSDNQSVSPRLPLGRLPSPRPTARQTKLALLRYSQQLDNDVPKSRGLAAVCHSKAQVAIMAHLSGNLFRCGMWWRASLE